MGAGHWIEILCSRGLFLYMKIPVCYGPLLGIDKLINAKVDGVELCQGLRI